MSNVKYHPVHGGVKDSVDGYSQFHCTKIRGKMSAGLGNGFDQVLAKGLAKCLSFTV